MGLGRRRAGNGVDAGPAEQPARAEQVQRVADQHRAVPPVLRHDFRGRPRVFDRVAAAVGQQTRSAGTPS